MVVVDDLLDSEMPPQVRSLGRTLRLALRRQAQLGPARDGHAPLESEEPKTSVCDMAHSAVS